jgi:oligosaccharide repeat unit polymerase
MRVSAWQVLIGILLVAQALSWQSDIFFAFSELYWLVMGTSVLCFFVGYWSISWIFLKSGGGRLFYFFTSLSLPDESAHKTFLAMFWLFFSLGVLNRFLMFGPTFFMPDIVMQYRISVVMEDAENVIKGLSLGNFFLFMMPTYIIAYRDRFGAMTLAVVVVAVLFNVYLSSGRSILFVSALSAFYFWVLPKKINVNSALHISLLILTLFYGFELIGQVVGKATDELSFIVYAAAPLHAFDALLGGEGTLDGYFLSFAPVQSIIANFFKFTPPTDLPNVLTPLPTNVYTMFGVYYTDYGMVGLFIVMALIGFFSGTLHKIYLRTGNGLLRIWTAINMTILTLSIFYDYYTTSGVIWMSFILSIFFFSNRVDFARSKRVRNKSSDETGADFSRAKIT